ncbi:MAG: hypothetical protein UY53_C0006G0042 [Parcubacteria group bacterium GW2011_GWA2_50_10]|nr:MAG: hypothetical protein UY53_C0006G0042 [Parcubacteria group bacterium GW2011_GWA2_50_10]
MEDKNLIAQISHLKEIKPRQEWVVLTRQRLFEEKAFGPIPEQTRYEVNLQKGGFWATIEGIASFMARSLQKPAFVIPMLALIVAGRGRATGARVCLGSAAAGRSAGSSRAKQGKKPALGNPGI